MLFAPKFDAFGCDVARAFLSRCGGGRVHGLCNGPPEVYEHVVSELGAFGGQFWRLECEEETWLSAPVSLDELKRLERTLGPGEFGRLIAADRRVGRGFVRGALTRPDRIARLAARDSRASPQKYVHGLYYFLDAVLKCTRPDTVFYYAVIDAPAVAMAKLCQERSIPFCRLTHTRLGDRYIVDTDMLGRHANITHRFEQARDGRSPYPLPMIAAAREYLAAFRARPTPPSYTHWAGLFRRSRSGAERVEHSFRFFVFSIALHCAKQLSRGRWPGVQVSRQFFKIWIAWRRQWSGKRFFCSMDDLPEEFIFFPLHVNPEASTMVLSPWHTDQIAIIEALAKAAPAPMKIVVKEHSPMLGLRPRDFYRQITEMPRVILLSPHLSSFDLIRKANLTAVITGTAAWEAIVLGKPALIVGDSPFLSLGEGLIYESDLTRLPLAIRAALSLRPVSDDTLALYIAAVLSESFSMSSSLLWGNYSAHSSEQRNGVYEAIATSVVRIMKEFSNNVGEISMAESSNEPAPHSDTAS